MEVKNEYCCYCGTVINDRRNSDGRWLTQDHLIPVSKGGVKHTVNKKSCCYKCNTVKADNYPEQWLEILEIENIAIRNRKDDNHKAILARKRRLYNLEIQIENLKYVIEYVQDTGEKLFKDDILYAQYLDSVKNCVAAGNK